MSRHKTAQHIEEQREALSLTALGKREVSDAASIQIPVRGT